MNEGGGDSDFDGRPYRAEVPGVSGLHRKPRVVARAPDASIPVRRHRRFAVRFRNGCRPDGFNHDQEPAARAPRGAEGGCPAQSPEPAGRNHRLSGVLSVTLRGFRAGGRSFWPRRRRSAGGCLVSITAQWTGTSAPGGRAPPRRPSIGRSGSAGRWGIRRSRR